MCGIDDHDMHIVHVHLVRRQTYCTAVPAASEERFSLEPTEAQHAQYIGPVISERCLE